jgi:D-glycerate 3-kinase
MANNPTTPIPQMHPPPPEPHIVDDKPVHCIPFILSRLQIHRAQKPNCPFFIGLNGVQGVGKTTLVRALSATLRNQEHLETLVCSIDDLYLEHENQVALARGHVNNPLVQYRGEPGIIPQYFFFFFKFFLLGRGRSKSMC